MFFTQQDYEKIEKWLSGRGGKDSSFTKLNSPEEIKEVEDFIALVQDGVNKTVTIDKLSEKAVQLRIDDIDAENKRSSTHIFSQEGIQFLLDEIKKGTLQYIEHLQGQITENKNTGNIILDDLGTKDGPALPGSAKNVHEAINNADKHLSTIDKELVNKGSQISGLQERVTTNESSIENIERVNAEQGNKISNTESTLNEFIRTKGEINGLAPLGADRKVPSAYLPDGIDEILEVDNYNSLPNPGLEGKIYVTLDDGKTYRWSGTQYTEISASVALGETEGTAYYGEKGKKNADDIKEIERKLFPPEVKVDRLHTNPVGENVKLYADLEEEVNLDVEIVPEAPKDGKEYVRKDGAWYENIDRNVNEYNISAINGTPYAGLQEALTALDTYLTAKGIAKSVGIKVTYVQTDVMRAKTYSFSKMGRFTDVANWADEPDGGFKKDYLLSFRGVTFNKDENSFYLNGVKLTQEQMTDIAVAMAEAKTSIRDYSYAYFQKDKIVTNIPFYDASNAAGWTGDRPKINLVGMFQKCDNLRVVRIWYGGTNVNCYFNRGDYAFAFCRELEEIQDILIDSSDSGHSYMFRDCKKLRLLRIKSLTKNIDLRWSPLLNVAQDGTTGLGYMITNANPAGGFTITLAKVLEQNPDVIYWVGEAQKKNITIAFA